MRTRQQQQQQQQQHHHSGGEEGEEEQDEQQQVQILRQSRYGSGCRERGLFASAGPTYPNEDLSPAVIMGCVLSLKS